MTKDSEDPTGIKPLAANGKKAKKNGSHKSREAVSLFQRIKDSIRPRRDTDDLREAIEDYIEDLDEDEQASVAAHEKALISNILNLRDLTVVDIMIPRADIVAIDVGTSQKNLLHLLADKQYSRIVVYKGSLDDVVGTVHIKDILSHLAKNKKIEVKTLVREVPVVSPAMPVLDLILYIRQSKKHMALVIDEYGGIDGLITIGDIIEAIVGEIDDEFEQDIPARLEEKEDGSILADARVGIEEFEDRFGEILTQEEREENDTLGGLVFSVAGRVPARGETLRHESGMIFEVLDADPRRISCLRIKNIPKTR